jgi:Superfamily II DNA/RNA helicases, SNF2 family
MTVLEINANHIYVQCSDIKGDLLGGTYVNSRNAWRLPHNLGAIRDLIEQGYPLHKHLGLLQARFNLMVRDKTYGIEPEYPNLRNYQNQDVNFLLSRSALGVFSEQRTGKTPTTCTLIGQVKVNTMIIVPTSLVLDWKAQIERWAGMEVITATGTPKQRLKAYTKFHESQVPAVLVLSKGVATKDADMLRDVRYDMVIIDEAHFLRNYKTKQSEAMYKLGRGRQYRYALTGTPASNSPDDVFGILKFLYPDRFTSYWQFCERYFKIDDGYFGKKVDGKFKTKSREQEYYELMEQFAIQRKRKDVMKWLQGKQYQKVELEMDTKQQKKYEQMAKTFVTEKADGEELDASTVLAQMTRLRQLSLAPESVQVEAPSAKEAYILEWLENNGDEPVLIFSNFTSYLNILYGKIKKAKHKVALVTGEQDIKERQKATKDFQSGKIRVLLCNIEAAGVGLTLDRAETSIFLDRHYNPTWNMQAEDRLVATTEEAPQGAFIIDLVCKGTIDEAIHEMVEKKVDITKIVNDFSDLRKIALGGQME